MQLEKDNKMAINQREQIVNRMADSMIESV